MQQTYKLLYDIFACRLVCTQKVEEANAAGCFSEYIVSACNLPG